MVDVLVLAMDGEVMVMAGGSFCFRFFCDESSEQMVVERRKTNTSDLFLLLLQLQSSHAGEIF